MNFVFFAADILIRVRSDMNQTSNLNLPLEKRPIGGLGVYLARQAMDEVHHRITSTGGNELTLVKRRPDQKT